MALKQLIILVILFKSSYQEISDNKVETDDPNPLAEAAAAILKEQNAQNIGGMLNNLMQSDGAKQIGDMIANAATSENAGQILQGLGSMLNQNQGIDPSMLGMVMNMFQQNKNGKKGDDYGDNSNIFSFLFNLMGQGGDKNILDYLPMILQTISAFTGPEAEERVHAHSGHAALVPPILERFHLFFDHFMNSEMGRQLINIIGAEKFVRVFADDTGKLSYRKLVDMLENHSFRRHWIRMVTDRIATILSYISDPKIQKKFIVTFQHFINSILKSQGYPKSALFDPNRPTESLTALINHFAKDSMNIKISSKQYVKPAVEYFQDILKMAQKKGMLKMNSQQLSDKLADTINLEVIEPIARVNRAYRFARKKPECDKYVMCLINQEQQDERASLPGLKPLLSKSASLIFSWFLSTYTGTPYWTLYRAITENNSCQARFLDVCNDFHVEETKVHKEYVHSEL